MGISLIPNGEFVTINEHKIHIYRQGNKNNPKLVFMSGLEAIRWKQKYPDEVRAMIGLDMATPQTYKEWSNEEIDKRINMMKRIKKIKSLGLLSWYPLNKQGLNGTERKQQRLLWKRNGMNDCFIEEAKAVLNNAIIVEESGGIDCPTLLFVSNGKQVSPKWLEHQREFAKQMKAELVYLNCGHYIHYFKSDEMYQVITEFIDALYGK